MKRHDADGKASQRKKRKRDQPLSLAIRRNSTYMVKERVKDFHEKHVEEVDGITADAELAEPPPAKDLSQICGW